MLCSNIELQNQYQNTQKTNTHPKTHKAKLTYTNNNKTIKPNSIPNMTKYTKRHNTTTTKYPHTLQTKTMKNLKITYKINKPIQKDTHLTQTQVKHNIISKLHTIKTHHTNIKKNDKLHT